MDLSKLDIATKSDEGVVVHLYHPGTRAPLYTDKQEPITMTVAGEQSDVFQKAQKAVQNRRLSARGKLKLDADILEAEALDTLCKCVLGWSNIMVDGVSLDYNQANVRRVLSDRRFAWLKRQLDEAITDEGNFIKE